MTDMNHHALSQWTEEDMQPVFDKPTVESSEKCLSAFAQSIRSRNVFMVTGNTFSYSYPQQLRVRLSSLRQYTWTPLAAAPPSDEGGPR